MRSLREEVCYVQRSCVGQVNGTFEENAVEKKRHVSAVGDKQMALTNLPTPEFATRDPWSLGPWNLLRAFRFPPWLGNFQQDRHA